MSDRCGTCAYFREVMGHGRRCFLANRAVSAGHRDLEVPGWCPGWAPVATKTDPAQQPVVNLYAELDRVLAMARVQAVDGKGRERHALPGQPFEEQVIVAGSLALGSNHGNLLQIVKKAQESTRLPKDRAIAELLGVINNAAAAVLVLERLDEQKGNDR